MIGRTLWDEFFSNNDWPMASAVAVAMILLVIVPLALFNRYQAEAEQAVRRLTHEGWADFKQQIGKTDFGFAYDQNEVKLLVSSQGDGSEPVHAYEINLHGETIAEFGVTGAKPLSDEDAELVAIVGQRLSAQLENLRLTQQTEQALAEVRADNKKNYPD